MMFARIVARLCILCLFLFVVETSSGAQEENGTVFSNLFAWRMCGIADSEFCPGGQFDDAAFEAMYLDPTSNSGHYPTEGSGDYERRIVPTCEGDSCGDDLIRCTDGTRPLFYYKQGSGEDADKWLIKIQGGGSTCAGLMCSINYGTTERNDFSSAYGLNGGRKNYRGIFSTSPNNLFRDYNLVNLDKCVGDRNMGDNTIANNQYTQDTSGPLYFHGYRIILAVLQSLKAQASDLPNLEDAELVVFSTQSNGSNGAYMYIDRLQEYVQDEIAASGNTPDVRLLASSYFLPNPEVEYAIANLNGNDEFSLDPLAPFSTELALPLNYHDNFGHVDDQTTSSTICGNGFNPSDPYYQDWIDSGKKVDGGQTCQMGIGEDHLRGIGGMFFSTEDYATGREANNMDYWGASDDSPTIDASCYAAHLATGDTEACHDSIHVMMYHLTTPTFFAAQMADRNIRTTRLTAWTVTFNPAQCDQDDVDCHGENFRGDTSMFTGEPIPSEGSWQKEDFRLRILGMIQERFAGSSPHQEQPSGNGHGAFIDNTVDHMGLAEMNKLRRTMRPSAGADPRELQEYLFQWLEPANIDPVICIDPGQLYDSEFAPLSALPDAPAGLACNSGHYYDPGTPIDPAQDCNDPFANVASELYFCPAFMTTTRVFLPAISRQ